jgi:hypothetical protein
MKRPPLSQPSSCVTDPTAYALVSGIRQRQGDEAALLAADSLAQRRAERVTTAGV